MLIPSGKNNPEREHASLSRRVNANSQHFRIIIHLRVKLIKKGEC